VHPNRRTIGDGSALLTPQQRAQRERREREKEVHHNLELMDVRDAITDVKPLTPQQQAQRER
jgi:hypothetical protein